MSRRRLQAASALGQNPQVDTLLLLLLVLVGHHGALLIALCLLLVVGAGSQHGCSLRAVAAVCP
jgi:hypothetical protein